MSEGTNDYSDISPKYIMELIPEIENTLWEMFDSSKYKRVKQYIQKWHKKETGPYEYWENFPIIFRNDKEGAIDLNETLCQMPNDILIQIAIDLGVDTPGFLPMVPTFKNVLKDSNENAFKSFDRAIKNTQDNPDEAVSLANSTLEGIIKTVLSNPVFKDLKYDGRGTLYTLTSEVLKRLNLFPQANQGVTEIRNIGSALLKASQNIESLRSTKTKSHGKSHDEYIISDKLWASFVVNSVATIGLFISEFFSKKYHIEEEQSINESTESVDVNPEDIPF